MPFEEISDVKGMKDDARFDAHLKFGDKRASKSVSKHGSSQHINATDKIVDEAFLVSAGIIPVNQ